MHARLFFSFFKIGLFTFGGGYAMIPLIQREVVDRRGWMEESDFVDMLAVAQSAPGPISLNTAVFVGNKVGGRWGSVFTALGIILPSFAVILLVALFFTRFRTDPVVERIFKGIRPAVVALIAAPLWRMGKQAGVRRQTLWLPLAVVVLIGPCGVSPVYVIAGVILWGILSWLWRKREK